MSDYKDFEPKYNYTPADTEKPFRFWCQKVLPAVYDDSLSYYELLAKVIDYLNKTMKNVNLLGTDVDELEKTYKQLVEWVNAFKEYGVNRLDSQDEEIAHFENETNEKISDFENATNEKITTFENETNEKISDFENATNEKIATFENETNEKIATFENETNEKIATFENETNEKISDFENATNEKIANFENETNEKISDFENATNEKIANFENETNEKISTFENETAKDINEYKQAISNIVDDLTAKLTSSLQYMDSQLNSIDGKVESAVDGYTTSEEFNTKLERVVNESLDDTTIVSDMKEIKSSLADLIISVESGVSIHTYEHLVELPAEVGGEVVTSHIPTRVLTACIGVYYDGWGTVDESTAIFLYQGPPPINSDVDYQLVFRSMDKPDTVYLTYNLITQKWDTRGAINGGIGITFYYLAENKEIKEES